MLLLTGALFAPVSMPVSTQAALLPTQRLRTDGGCWGTSPGPRGSFFDRAGHLTEEVVKAEGAVWECVAGCSASKLPSEFWLVCVCVCVCGCQVRALGPIGACSWKLGAGCLLLVHCLVHVHDLAWHGTVCLPVLDMG